MIHVLGKGGEGHLGVETVRLGIFGTYQQTVREDTESVTWQIPGCLLELSIQVHLGIQYNSQSA